MVVNNHAQLQNMVSLFLLTFIILLYPAFSHRNSSAKDLETYIVHLTAPDSLMNAHQYKYLKNWYHSFLPAVNPDKTDENPRMVYTYSKVFTGFAARLSKEEAKAMEKLDEVISARPQRVLNLQTTHSPNFLGLHKNSGFWRKSNYGKGLVIGLLDTGITPFHPSFNDQGMPSPPARWRGKCEFTSVGACNNKIIGARTFLGGSSVPPIDEGGHGTFTASTAAGNFVKGANVLGNANGTAVGIAPLAHLAIYKVCDEVGCRESDMVAAIDAAIEEGVDVISVSIGGLAPLPFFEDVIAISTFAAMKHGIFASFAAGNGGPFNTTLSNEAPWMLTVGASTIDRKIKSTVYLGNKELFEGETVFQPKDFPKTFLPLVFPGTNGDQDTIWCAEGSLDDIDVRGKFVLCERGGGIARTKKGQTVKDAGGAAMILINDKAYGDTTLAEAHVLPATYIGFKGGVAIKTYINSTVSPIASMQFKGTIIGDMSAPRVAAFSSRGPCSTSPGILKPDIIGPGVNILAASHETVEKRTETMTKFDIVSGTSLACPHLAGIATLLKSAHRDWSPAAIKSAIMTTADLMSLKKEPITDESDLKADLYAIGAGHVNPSKANNPGLVYDIQPDDYIPYLCGLGYSDKHVGVIVGKKVSCSVTSSISEAELNYPSFAISLGLISQVYTRTLTNVDVENSSYVVEIFPPYGVTVGVKPSRLEFFTLNQKLSYEVTFTRTTVGRKVPFVEGFLKWTSCKHSVRSVISIKFL